MTAFGKVTTAWGFALLIGAGVLAAKAPSPVLGKVSESASAGPSAKAQSVAKQPDEDGSTTNRIAGCRLLFTAAALNDQEAQKAIANSCVLNSDVMTKWTDGDKDKAARNCSLTIGVLYNLKRHYRMDDWLPLSVRRHIFVGCSMILHGHDQATATKMIPTLPE